MCLMTKVDQPAVLPSTTFNSQKTALGLHLSVLNLPLISLFLLQLAAIHAFHLKTKHILFSPLIRELYYCFIRFSFSNLKNIDWYIYLYSSAHSATPVCKFESLCILPATASSLSVYVRKLADLLLQKSITVVLLKKWSVWGFLFLLFSFVNWIQIERNGMLCMECCDTQNEFWSVSKRDSYT